MTLRVLKRGLDLSVSVGLVIVLGPLLLLVSVLVRVILGKPILFTQARPGLHGESFILCKFRTMTTERGSDGQLLPDERRIHWFGQLLRKFSLDELPQLFNVIRGDMSLVGPRPLLEQYLPLYSPRQARRHDVLPGITGWAQINGRNAISWEQKFELDVWYVENQSFLLDLKILIKTAWKVIHKEGITQAGHVTTTPFQGSGGH